jgi:hypothetical protein
MSLKKHGTRSSKKRKDKVEILNFSPFGMWIFVIFIFHFNNLKTIKPYQNLRLGKIR